MPSPDKQPPHNPKVPPQFDNSDTEEPQAPPSDVEKASPTGDARTGRHRGEVGNESAREGTDRSSSETEMTNPTGNARAGESRGSAGGGVEGLDRDDVERERPKDPM